MSDPTASPISRERIRRDLRARRIRVSHVQRMSENMIRVTFEGDALRDFESLGPHDHLKLIVPDQDGSIPEPTIVDGSLQRPFEATVRDYTPRTYDQNAGRLAIEFFDHEDPGPATRWARAAEPGQEVVIMGPRGSQPVPNGAESLLLFADEAALPSVARWIEMSDLPVRAHLLGQEGEHRYLHSVAGAERCAVTWHAHADELIRACLAVREVEDTCYVWCGGEAMMLAALRRHLRTICAPAQLKVTGYWRDGLAGYDHHAPLPD
ncbi:MAG: siderophore-interacting protein [Bowdeniella nasicola]|nr:siderophore-interacting protein [Bowdeniella nasicola]